MQQPVRPHRHATGLTRREVLQVGYSGLLGVGLAGLLARKARAASAAPAGGRAKSVLLVFLTGGPSHIDTFDPKPDAPAEVRGEFNAVASRVPGVRFAEHLPRLAARMDRLAVVRSLSHPQSNHLLATHHVLTGTAIPGGKFDQVASRNDWPDYAAGLDYLRPRSDGMPTGVNLPTFLVEGPLTWPGQHAGFLGPRHDPWQVRQDPNLPEFHVDGFGLAAGLGVERLGQRRGLLERIDAVAEGTARSEGGSFGKMQERAFTMLASGKVAGAFEIGREPDKMRERYGRHLFGQSLLLARRLVQAGVPVVQANMGRVQNWDSHADVFRRLKRDLLPPLDQAVAALLDDLEELGLLDQTLVMVLGEFGRTPKLSGKAGNAPGRDHWPRAFTGVFAGAGVRGGQVIGKTDKIGAYPTTPPYTPDDVGATVYHALGVNHDADIDDPFGRPVRLNRGAPIEALYTAAG